MPVKYTKQALLRTHKFGQGEEPAPKKDPLAEAEPSLRDLLSAVNSASSGARNAWLAFLGLLAYLAVTLAGITHKDLLLNAPTTLPFVNVKIPLTGFFSFAPAVLLFFHFGLMVQHAMLFSKIEAFTKKLRGDAPDHVWPDHPVQDELHSYFFTQSFAGRKPQWFMACAFHTMAMISFILTPVFVFFYFQIKFLPFHDEFATWLHRGYLLIDIIFLIIIGFFLGQLSARKKKARLVKDSPLVLMDKLLIQPLLWLGVSRTAVLFTFVLSLIVATVPDGYAEKYVIAQTNWTQHAPIDCNRKVTTGRRVYAPTAWLFERKKLNQNAKNTPWYCHASVWLGGSRNLDVADIDFVKDKNITKGETTINLRDRNLQYADFSRSDLKQADFHGAKLRRARFIQSDLKAAKFRTAQAQGADLYWARLQGANLRSARLQGADLRWASLQGADLGSASLQGADLREASLQGADLRKARIWLTRYPQDDAAPLASLSALQIVKPDAKEQKDFMAVQLALMRRAEAMAKEKTPGRARVAAAANKIETIGKKLREGKETGEWQAIHAKWRAWAGREKRKLPKDDDIACYLGEMACGDNTEKAFVAQRLISVRIAPERGKKLSPSIFYTRFKNCPAAKKIPAILMARLMKAAAEDAANRIKNTAEKSKAVSTKPQQCSWK